MTVLALKQILRKRISSRNRLRLIHQGRLLPDSSALSAVLRPLAPPPLPSGSFSKQHARYANADTSVDVKGKGIARELRDPEVEVRAITRIYVNCAIGDQLSPEELAAEEVGAENPPDASSTANVQPQTSVRPRPRGFDRFLQSGFTQSEVATLRTQFASIHSERFNADSPPSPDSLRDLEDAWIDSNAGEALPATGGAAAGDVTGILDGDDAAGMLDAMINGMVMGFFFPLGCMTWLLRERVWNEKWQIFVGSGVMLSLTIGVIKGISGDP